MGHLSITILGLDTDKGHDLVGKLKAALPLILNEVGYADPTINVVYNGQQYDMLKACMADDLVIFDASIELNEYGSWDSNYAAATANPCALDNILVVSRTRLPFNFSVLRTNVPELGQTEKDEKGQPVAGIKDYRIIEQVKSETKQMSMPIKPSTFDLSNIPELGHNDKDDKSQPITLFENEIIVEWVKSEIRQMSKPFKPSESSHTFPPRIPVNKDLKFNIPPFEQLGTVDSSFFEIQEKKMLDSLDYMAAKRKGAFISYRSYYYKQEYHGKTAQDLIRLIKDLHEDQNYPVTIYAEGDIAFEFMTEQRRWFVESFVDRKMRTMDEIWIFETNDEDGYGYYDSWWTQGEIISLMYMKANGSRLPKIYVYYYDEQLGEMRYVQKDESFIPNLTKELNHELSQYFANAEGANEGMENMRTLRSKSLLYKRLAHFAMKQMQKRYMNTETMNKVMDGNDYKAFLDSIYSHVYDKSFTENRIVYCPSLIHHYTIDDFHRPQFIRDFMHINSARDDGKYKDEIESRGFYSVSPQEMRKIEETGTWQLPNSNDIKRIKKLSNPQFQWWPIRQGSFTGPNNVIIEKIDNWEFVK